MYRKWDIFKDIPHYPKGQQKYDVQLYLIKRQEKWVKYIKKALEKAQTIKFDIKLIVKLQKETKPGESIYCSPCFRSNARSVVSKNEISSIISIEIEKILNSYDSYMKGGSGWVLKNVFYSQLNIYKYEIWGGGGKTKLLIRELYLPKNLAQKNNSITLFPPTSDNKCFLYCILAALFRDKTSHKLKNEIKPYLSYEKNINTKSISYPTKINEISNFEKDNNLLINVITVDKKGENLRFLHKGSNESQTPINLLLYNKHFSLINSWSSFLNFSKKNKRLLCQKCGNFYMKKRKACSICSFETVCQSLKFLPKGSKQTFKNFKNVSLTNFVYYADIETELVKFEDQNDSKTKKVKNHQPLAIGLYRICLADEFSHNQPILHIGSDCMKKFFQTLEKEIDFMDFIQSTINYPLDMTEAANENFRLAKECYVCFSKFSEKVIPQRDHNHLLKYNNYRGAICNSCNLNRTDTEWTQTPIIFHNGSRYDSHFLIQNLHLLKEDPTKVIGRSGENVMTFSLFRNRFKIMDSINHLSSALDKLISMVKKSGKKFPNTKKVFGDDIKTQNLICQKGFFPYDLLSLANLEKITSFPSKNDFFDDLTGEKISDENYEHAEKVWKHMRCRNLQDYLKIYLTADITLLADVFENFRSFFYRNFSLDCTKYVSLSGLSYDSMMRFTRCEIDLIHEEEMFLFIRRAMRGGVTQINQKLAYCNNKYLKNYNPSQETSYIIYLDCNGLYSSVMNMALPQKNLRWKQFSLESMKKIIQNYDSFDKVGYFIECDLDYPKKIHNLTKDLPLAAEHRIVSDDMLSPYSQDLKKKLEIKSEKIPKLLCTQFDKKNYVCHIENLKFYLRMGMILKKVHRVLAFDQSAFLAPYIKFCMKERNKPGVTEDERALFKLSSNSIFGRSIMSPLHNTSINFISNEKKLLKYVNRNTFKHADKINKHVIQVTNTKKTSKITTPYFVGVAILEISKSIMLKFHYDVFIAKYGVENISLLMSDTDSFIYRISTENLDKDLKNMKIIDFSNYPSDHENFDTNHKGEMFFLKDESASRKIKSFVGLKSKMYSISYDDNSLNTVSAKGIPRREMKKISFDDMVDVLVNNTETSVTSKLFRSYKHLIYTISQTKKALSPYDTKRYQIDGIYTLPFGNENTLPLNAKKRQKKEIRLNKENDPRETKRQKKN